MIKVDNGVGCNGFDTAWHYCEEDAALPAESALPRGSVARSGRGLAGALAGCTTGDLGSGERGVARGLRSVRVLYRGARVSLLQREEWG